MVCVPVALKVTPARTALPVPLNVTALPLFRDVVLLPTVSVNVTPPVGIVVVWPVAVSVTIAVSETAAPVFTTVGVAATATAVESAALNPVPLTATCCVELATFRLLSVNVTLALKLPAVCGVNFKPTSHAVPAARDVVEVHRLVSLVLFEKLVVYPGFAENTSG
jgi:hypothetical protein